MTEIKRYDVNKANMIGLVRFDEKESGQWVKYEDLAAIQEQLSRYSMSAGQADQRNAESDAVRVALGFSADADDVSPSDLVDAISALKEQVRALAAENSSLARYFSASSVAVNHWNSWADTEDKLACAPETPTTDAALREIRAQDVDGFAQDCDDNFGLVEPEEEELYVLMAESAREHAARIRSGEQP